MMPTFCRHNHLLHNCPICSREERIEMRPVLTSSAPRGTEPRAPKPAGQPRKGAGPAGLKVRRLARGSDDGYHSPLVPGLKSSIEAGRLAEELAFAATRLELLQTDPPGLYAEIRASDGDIEERTWLAFLIAYCGPLDGEDPFASVRTVRTGWAGGENPDPSALAGGPRGAHDPVRGTATLDAYRNWAARAGSQAAAFAGEGVWTPERRFARAFERLALPGLHRDARFDLLVTLGRVGLYELEAGSLVLGGDNSVTVGAKRALGIGDPILLDRRAAELAGACAVPLEALDLAFYNWERGGRHTGGLPPGSEPDPEPAERTRAALKL